MRSYMVVTVSAVLIIDLLLGALIGYAVSRPALEPQELAASASSMAPHLSRPLASAPGDATALAQALKPLLRDRMSAAVADRKLAVRAFVPEWSGKVGAPLFAHAPEAQVLAGAALAGEASPARLSSRDAQGNALTLVPILGARQQVLGLLLVKMDAPVKLRDFSRAMVGTLLVSALLVGLFAAVVGLGFGYLTARRLAQRLQAIADAADAWSRGEFSTMASDDSDDEVGQLAHRLNQMALELRQLVVLRQNLATAEERNRLSRELHDTVKQQVFATAMQVGAARVLLDRDTELARARLAEGERLAAAAQQELTSILEQLRPGSYARQPEPARSLESLLRDYARDWARQSGIEVQVLAEPIPDLPAATQQALLRITQESLANVSRHSQAAKVTVNLATATVDGGAPGLRLVVSDDGRGFDPSHAALGLGLRSMRERAEALPGGSLVVQSRAGHGTRVEVRCCTSQAAGE